jgi:hypothetical protein
MTGIYVAFVGIDHYNFYLKTAMFVLLLVVLSSLSRLAIPLHIPEMGGHRDLHCQGDPRLPPGGVSGCLSIGAQSLSQSLHQSLAFNCKAE